jgi:hypothetical protein
VDRETLDRAAAMLGRPVTGWRTREGGWTAAATGVVALADGSTAFLKVATDEQSGDEIRAEAAVLGAVTGSFMPGVVAAETGDLPMLALEDLSHGHWPEPYPADVSGLEAALAELRGLAIPGGLALERLDPPGPERADGLVADAVSAAPVLADWVSRHNEAIRTALGGGGVGEALVHTDLWYPNVCFLPDRVVFVDWSHARIGSPWHDAATLSIDLVLGGYYPLAVADGGVWAAAWLAHALRGLAAGPPPAGPPEEQWRIDLEELADGAAWWLADLLDLPPAPRLTTRTLPSC